LLVRKASVYIAAIATQNVFVYGNEGRPTMGNVVNLDVFVIQNNNTQSINCLYAFL